MYGLSPRISVEVSVESVSHHYDGPDVLSDVSLNVKGGEFLTLLGPSGSGKTTLLRIVGGLIRPQYGRVMIGNQDVTDVPVHKRGAGFVFQNYALFPHMNVFENVAFPLRIRRLASSEILSRVSETLRMVQLHELGARLPHELSGGQQQRVAVARAVIFRPRVLLMDEPLGALDKHLRRSLQAEIRELQKEIGITTIYVTHDQAEAFSMSDRIAVMANGRILQIACPAALYSSPADSFVARFVGDLNEFTGVVRDQSARQVQIDTFGGVVTQTTFLPLASGDRVLCGLRPEHVRLIDHGSPGRAEAVVIRVVPQGSRQHVELRTRCGMRLVADVGSELKVTNTQEVAVAWDDSNVHIFPRPADWVQ
jgi:spermidine/putrescine ABC transporter ATP-binding subunit